MTREPTETVITQLLSDGVIAAARAGDAVAIEAVITQSYPLIQRFLRYLSGDPIVADDLTQDVMLNAARHLAELATNAALRPWLYQIARNAWLSHVRRQRGRQTASFEQWMEHPSSHRGIVEPVSAIEEAEDAIVVQQLLSGLSGEQRELIYLRYIAGFTAAEIGVVLNTSHATARQRIHRAVIIMRQQSQVLPSHTEVPNVRREATSGAT